MVRSKSYQEWYAQDGNVIIDVPSKLYFRFLIDWVLFLFIAGANPCFWDNGGPLVIQGTNIQIGVFVLSPNPAPGFCDLFGNIYYTALHYSLFLFIYCKLGIC